MDFGNRLKNIRLNSRMTQQDLANKVGVSVVAVRNWEHGTKKPSLDGIVALSKVLCISSDMLLGIQDSNKSMVYMELSPAENKLLSDYLHLDEHGRSVVDSVCALEKDRIRKASMKPISLFGSVPQKPSIRYIPHYTTPSAAGVNVPLDETEYDMIKVEDGVPSDADYAVDIHGNSMYPYIKDGETVYIRKVENVYVGDVCIFCVDGAMYCKQYWKDRNGTVVLASANPDLRHTNIVLPPDGSRSVQLCGKVIMRQKAEIPYYLIEE